MVNRFVVLAVATLALLVSAPASWADEWSLELSSVTPGGSNFSSLAVLEGMSADGRHVFFRTNETLVPEDQNGFTDLYDRHDGTTELISIGPKANGYESPFALHAVSPDGGRVIFQTVEDLVPSDDNGLPSLYQRYQGTTTLIEEEWWGNVIGVSEDASLVYYRLNSQPEPGVTINDLYVWDGQTATLLTGPGSPIQDTAPGFSRDGTRIYFRSGDQLDPADTDSCADLYVYSAGMVSLISGPAYPPDSCINGAGFRFKGESVDGAHVFFETTKWIDPVYGHGTESDYSLFEHVNGQNEIVVQPYDWGVTEFNAVSDDGDVLAVSTGAQLVPEDTDTAADLYKRENGQFELIPGAYQAISRDGRIFFLTSSSLAPDDTDTTPDIYVRDGSYNELITSNVPWDTRGYQFVGVSNDGGRAFFSAIAPPRCLFSHEIYSHASANTGLCDLNAQGPIWRLAADGTRAAGHSSQSLLPSDSDGSHDVYAANLVMPTGYPRPRGATPTRVSLVPAFTSCTGPNRTHGAPLSFGSCHPPAPASANASIGGNDGILAARSIGSVTLKVQQGTAGAPDDADVKVSLSITNVMKPADNSDYTGELRLELPVRITDRLNGAPVDSGTVTDTSIFATVPCTPTPDSTAGSTCTLSTTVDTLVPNTVLEGWKAVWGLGQIRLHDGGADGDGDTPGDNQLFATQGVFVP